MATGAQPREIDCLHLGRERVICCWQVGDILIDPGPTSCLDTVLEALDGREPRVLLLTHIHLDHAGATGTLARRFPDLEVYVHERGARHMISPERLIQSASRLYGDDMERLWGAFEPVPQERLHVLVGGERLDLGGRVFDVGYTPGHASHHVSYLHDGTAFTGDVGGCRVVPAAPPIPPTPPPDIDVEAWHRSLELLASWRPERLAMTHFGPSEQVDGQLTELAERLDRWAELARTEPEDEWIAGVREEMRSRVSASEYEAFLQAVPSEQAFAGLRRYWDKRAESE
jgi:glyoxylase-like metal-dependent hydrolase (beta-lactamase superfamily II)